MSIPISTYAFSVYYAEDRGQKKIIISGIVLTIVVATLNSITSFTQGIYHYSWGYYIKLGSLGLLALLLYLCFIPAFIHNLYIKFKKAQNGQKIWSFYVLLTGGLAFLGISDFLPAYGIALPFPPIGYVMVGIFATLMSYFILRYQLTDIKLIMGRTIGYTVLTSILIFFYVSFFLIFSPSLWNTSTLIINALFFTICLYLFSLFKDKTQQIVDEIFFKEKIDFPTLISQFNNNLRNLRDSTSLLTILFTFLQNDLRIQTCTIFILKKNEMRWQVFEQNNPSQRPQYININNVQTIENYFIHNSAIISLNSFVNLDKSLENINALARQYHGVLIIPLVNRSEYIGFILFGKKMSQESYFSKDIKALESLTAPFIIAWENANYYDSLQKSNLLKSDFVSIASHQLRTPITAVGWALEMVAHEKKGILNDQQKKWLLDAIERIQYIKKMVDQLLSIVHLESGELKITLLPCDLNRIIQEVTNDMRHELVKKNISLVYNAKYNLPPALTDQNLVKIILNIIVENAIQYAINNGTITVTTRLFSIKGAQTILTTIHDTGIGIPEKEHAKVFTQFFRAQNAFSHFPNGTGNGLYYVKKLIETLDGSIWFRSTEGKGTTFYFTLPLAL